jgi:hypothetical protein
MVEVGEAVLFTDENRGVHHALVTAVWSETCINLVFVSGDEKRSDVYGRQTEHKTSVPKKSETQNMGFSWEEV